MSTILIIIKDLLDEKLIREGACYNSRIGRRPVPLDISPSGGYFIGIEFNSKRIQGVMLDFSKEQVYTEMAVIENDENAGSLIEKIVTLIQHTITALPDRKAPVFGIGIGLPGFFNAESGTAISYDFLPFWKDIPIKKIIEDRFTLPCFLENNVTVMAIAYRWLRLTESPEDFLFVSIRTGVRIVSYYHGHVLFEQKSFAGQLGHIKIPGSNRLCGCGQRGCLNTEVAEPGIRNKMIEMILNGRFSELFARVGRNFSNLNMDVFIEAVRQKDPDALELAEDSAKRLGYCLGMLVDILAPLSIVISGKLVEFQFVLDHLTEAIRRNTISSNSSKLRLISSTLDDNAGAWGAAAMVLQHQFNFEALQI
jgi:predicted NBD/HSP70 family sugar kinase